MTPTPQTSYPKIKYQGVPVPPPIPGHRPQWDAENPGYIYVKVASADEEKSLADSGAGDWYDTPKEAMDATKSAQGAGRSGSGAGSASGTAAGDPAGVEGAAKQTGDWPRQGEKKK